MDSIHQEQLMNVLNLVPGRETDFLGLKWKFLLPGEILPDDIMFSHMHMCDGLNDSYVAKEFAACEYKIVIHCSRDETSELKDLLVGKDRFNLALISKLIPKKYNYTNLKGVVGIIFAKKELDGLYISVICSTSYIDKRQVLPTKFGLVLQTAMQNFAIKHLGITNFYNHAASKPLVKYYKKLGWVLGDKQCDLDDPIANKFTTIETDTDMEEFLESFEVKQIVTKSGYPMRLCGVDLSRINLRLFSEIDKVFGNLMRILSEKGTLCLPKEPFYEYLEDEDKRMPEGGRRRYKKFFYIHNYDKTV